MGTDTMSNVKKKIVCSNRDCGSVINPEVVKSSFRASFSHDVVIAEDGSFDVNEGINASDGPEIICNLCNSKAEVQDDFADRYHRAMCLMRYEAGKMFFVDQCTDCDDRDHCGTCDGTGIAYTQVPPGIFKLA